ncbi:sensor histidine kinase [Calidifontibacter indicus]|uniref:sensor histidine kinase n=1 Tax=Calidifontibacter indicus TaxID=419650 RepID=UPI001FEA3E90|nr:HAMP domain-containing sensor histidine kinase [Calidifontibacter indicus]
MQQKLVRQATATVLIALSIVAVPGMLFAAGWWRRLGIAGLCIAAVAVGYWFARRTAREISEPVQQLAAQAELVGDGSAVFRPLRTDIDEINRISQVFERRTGELTRSLASEREFASDASHQLRTPLTALLMRLEEISMSHDLSAAHEEAKVGIAQVERLNGVVDELLQRARRTPTASMSAISLDSVIAALQREFQPAFADARRSVLVSGERGLWVVITRSSLSQILSTLFENALRHGSGTVEVRARRSGPSVVVEVSDRGEGVDPAIAPKVFDRSVSTGGTGLGLGLARDLADAAGGRLELRSARPAVFALFLSAGEPPATGQHP